MLQCFKLEPFLGVLLTEPSVRIVRTPERSPLGLEPLSRDQLLLKNALAEDRFGITHNGSLLVALNPTSTTSSTSTSTSSATEVVVFEPRGNAVADASVLRDLLDPRVQLFLAVADSGSKNLLVFEMLTRDGLVHSLFSDGAHLTPIQFLNALIDVSSVPLPL